MSFPVFASGDVLNASDMNAVGLWLVKSQAVGSGVTSVTVNNAFSADYKNYVVIAESISCSNDNSLGLQLTSGGTPSTTAYFGSLIFANAGSAQQATDTNAAQASYIGAHGVNLGVSLNVTVCGPFASVVTGFYNGAYARSTFYGTYNGYHAVAASYDGFKIIPSVGTMTGGTIRVYGYRN